MEALAVDLAVVQLERSVTTVVELDTSLELVRHPHKVLRGKDLIMEIVPVQEAEIR